MSPLAPIGCARAEPAAFRIVEPAATATVPFRKSRRVHELIVMLLDGISGDDRRESSAITDNASSGAVPGGDRARPAKARPARCQTAHGRYID
jgi:hypothetical protein